ESSGQASAQSTIRSVEGGLLDQILAESKLTQNEEEKNQVKLWLETLVRDVVDQKLVFRKDTDLALTERIAAIDALISKQLNEVIHAPEFQKLEASWRGLHYLVSKTETSTSLQIKVLHITRT